jgi:hypothetical protein
MHAEIQESTADGTSGTVREVLQFAEKTVDFNTFNTVATVGALHGISSFTNIIVGSALAWLLF